MLCRVLLNWDDDKAEQIINNCLKNIKNGQAFIILDFVIPDKNHKHYQRAILHDLNLLAVFGGRIRSLEEWKSLIKNLKGVQAKYKMCDEHVSKEINVPMVVIEIRSES